MHSTYTCKSVSYVVAIDRQTDMGGGTSREMLVAARVGKICRGRPACDVDVLILGGGAAAILVTESPFTLIVNMKQHLPERPTIDSDGVLTSRTR